MFKVISGKKNLCFYQQQTHLNFNFLMAEQRNQMRDYSRVYYHLYLFIASISKVREGPDCIYQYLMKKMKIQIGFEYFILILLNHTD